MNKKLLTREQFFANMRQAISTMTQEQIDACAWVMGCDNCGWNKENMIESLHASEAI
jgi:hypothetical protein